MCLSIQQVSCDISSRFRVTREFFTGGELGPGRSSLYDDYQQK